MSDHRPSGGAGSATISRPEMYRSVKRVNQLDAGVLDSELHGLLKTQLGRACSGLPAGTLERFKPEVDALFNVLMFRFTIWLQRPTPGMHLQGLRYRNDAAHRPAPADPNNLAEKRLSSAWGNGVSVPQHSSGHASATSSPWVGPHLGDAPTRTQMLVHALLSIGVQWGFMRLRQHGLVNGWAVAERGSARRAIWNVLRRLEFFSRLFWVINLLLFLKDGKYATPVDRLVRMRLVHEGSDQDQRSINYQFLNRRLLWDHWSKMTYVLAPLINWASISRTVRRGTARLRREARALGAIAGVVSASRSSADSGSRPGGSGTGRGVISEVLPMATACAECGVDPARIPYATECGHVFCYYCARMACTVDPCYACPACGTCFATSRRWCQPR